MSVIGNAKTIAEVVKIGADIYDAIAQRRERERQRAEQEEKDRRIRELEAEVERLKRTPNKET